MVNLNHNIDDEDLTKALATANGFVVTLERLRQNIEAFLSIAPTIKVTVLGYTLMTVEVKLNELQTVPEK